MASNPKDREFAKAVDDLAKIPLVNETVDDRAASPLPAEPPPTDIIRRRSRPFREYLMESLRSLPEAVAYLTAAKEDSPEMLARAVDDVIAANAATPSWPDEEYPPCSWPDNPHTPRYEEWLGDTCCSKCGHRMKNKLAATPSAAEPQKEE